MLFNNHSNLAGTHAFLSPSNYHWVNYDIDKLDRAFMTSMAAKRGNELHELAAKLIRLGIRLPDVKKTLNLYVNDAIGFRMVPEQGLYYSPNCYGTVDCIGYKPKQKLLRIHDLKTGVTEASVHQLEIYAALFCLEYRISPLLLRIELRIYQSDEVKIFECDPTTIVPIMDRIITFDKRITQIRLEAAL